MTDVAALASVIGVARNCVWGREEALLRREVPKFEARGRQRRGVFGEEAPSPTPPTSGSGAWGAL